MFQVLWWGLHIWYCKTKALTYQIISYTNATDTILQMHDDNLAIMRICNDCKKTFITQSSVEEHIRATGHKDIVKTSSGIMKTDM